MKQATHTANGQEYLIVQAPKGSWNYDIGFEDGWPYVSYYAEGNLSGGDIELPDDGYDYDIICIAETATEDEAAEVVKDSYSETFKVWNSFENNGFCAVAHECLRSLIRSKFPDTYKDFNHLILLKK